MEENVVQMRYFYPALFFGAIASSARAAAGECKAAARECGDGGVALRPAAEQIRNGLVASLHPASGTVTTVMTVCRAGSVATVKL